jgi:hypothetical protein
MLAWLKEHGYASDSLEGQSKEMAHSAMHDFPAVKRMLLNATPGNMLPNTYNMTKTFESPTLLMIVVVLLKAHMIKALLLLPPLLRLALTAHNQ